MTPKKSDDLKKVDIQKLGEIKLYIEEHYLKKIAIDDLVKLSGMTRNSIFAGFKLQNKKTIHEYITSLRMEKAKSLLDAGELLIKEVAAKVGYRSHKFSPAFKKAFAMTPTEYMRRLSK